MDKIRQWFVALPRVTPQFTCFTGAFSGTTKQILTLQTRSKTSLLALLVLKYKN
jgi:hypothetical protein